jgi:hypothetical protein
MGTNNHAADAAAAADKARQGQISDSVAQIDKAYSSPQRQAQIDQYGAGLKDYYTGQVNDQATVNARNLKFALARSGLTGGSAAVDSNTQFQKDYTKGLLQASQAAQTGQTALSQADVNAKNQLTSLAEQGAYTGTMPTQIAEAQKASLGAASNYGNANALGTLFGNTGQIYQNEQFAAANRKAQMNPIGSLYGSPGW